MWNPPPPFFLPNTRPVFTKNFIKSWRTGARMPAATWKLAHLASQFWKLNNFSWPKQFCSVSCCCFQLSRELTSALLLTALAVYPLCSVDVGLNSQVNWCFHRSHLYINPRQNSQGRKSSMLQVSSSPGCRTTINSPSPVSKMFMLWW